MALLCLHCIFVYVLCILVYAQTFMTKYYLGKILRYSNYCEHFGLVIYCKSNLMVFQFVIYVAIYVMTFCCLFFYEDLINKLRIHYLCNLLILLTSV